MSSEDNEKINFKYTNLQLRRDKVLELTAQGLQQSIIAERLGVSQPTISVDLQWARETAKSRMQTHIEERIPLQFEECTIGLRLLLRKTHELMNKSTRPQDQLHAMALAADIYSKLMDLSTNGSILQRTLQWLENKKKIELTPEEQKRMEEVLGSTEEEEEEEDEDVEEKEKE